MSHQGFHPNGQYHPGPHGHGPQPGQPGHPQPGFAPGPQHGGYGQAMQLHAPGVNQQFLNQNYLKPIPRRSNMAMNIISILIGVVGLLVLAFFLFIYAIQGGGVGFLLSFTLALLPISFVWLVVWFIDRWEPEPPQYLLAAVFWGGGVSVVLTLIWGLISSELWMLVGLDPNVWGAMFQAPLHEEVTKGLGLLVILLANRRRITGPVDGIVYGALIGAGFAFTENILYFVGALYEGGIAGIGFQFFFRGIALPLLHPICVSFTGIGVGLAARRGGFGRIIGGWFLGLIPAMAMHFAWNSIATFAGFSRKVEDGLMIMVLGFLFVMLPAFIIWIVIVVRFRKGESKILRERLGEYAAVGWYSPSEIEMLTSMEGRSGARKWARQLGPQAQKTMREFIRESTNLAIVRNQLLHNRDLMSGQRDEEETLEILTHLRQELNSLQQHQPSYGR